MAVADKEVISEEAMELLSCFYNGIDKIVYQLALEEALKRGKGREGVIEIEQADVERAGELLLASLKDLDTSNRFHGMLLGSKECFEGKKRKVK